MTRTIVHCTTMAGWKNGMELIPLLIMRNCCSTFLGFKTHISSDDGVMLFDFVWPCSWRKLLFWWIHVDRMWNDCCRNVETVLRESVEIVEACWQCLLVNVESMVMGISKIFFCWERVERMLSEGQENVERVFERMWSEGQGNVERVFERMLREGWENAERMLNEKLISFCPVLL